jgi:hypothetical protein
MRGRRVTAEVRESRKGESPRNQANRANTGLKRSAPRARPGGLCRHAVVAAATPSFIRRQTEGTVEFRYCLCRERLISSQKDLGSAQVQLRLDVGLRCLMPDPLYLYF